MNTKNIIFKNNYGLDILYFENIKLLFDNELKLIRFQLRIEFEFFRANTLLEVEEFDFMRLNECLYKMYNGQLKTFLFNPIGEQFIMKFELQENGQIKVSVILNNSMFTGKLEFNYITDQSFIPDLLKNLEISF